MKSLSVHVNSRRSTFIRALTSLGISIPRRASRTAYVRIHYRKIHGGVNETNHARPSLQFKNPFWGYKVLGCARSKNDLGRCCSDFRLDDLRCHAQLWGGGEHWWRDCWVYWACSERWLVRLDYIASSAPTGSEMVKVERLHLCILNYWAAGWDAGNVLLD